MYQCKHNSIEMLCLYIFLTEVTSPESYERLLEKSKQNAELIEKRYKALLEEYDVSAFSIFNSL